MDNTVKIGRHEYDIKVGDIFMDNGSCYQLLTQSKEKVEWGRQTNPLLSKKAWNKILEFPSYKKRRYEPTSKNTFIYEILEVYDENR